MARYYSTDEVNAFIAASKEGLFARYHHGPQSIIDVMSLMHGSDHETLEKMISEALGRPFKFPDRSLGIEALSATSAAAVEAEPAPELDPEDVMDVIRDMARSA